LWIESEAERVPQHGAQQAVAQRPQVPRPHPLQVTTVGQLSKDGLHERAHSSQDSAVRGRRLGRVGWAKGRVQTQPLAAQSGWQIRQPRGAIQEHDALGALQHERRDFAIWLMGQGQEQMGDQPRPAHPQGQPTP
jgi:hypothetical protein